MLRPRAICQCRLRQPQHPVLGNLLAQNTTRKPPSALPSPSTRLFSNSSILEARKSRNKQRGVSPLRRTGPRQRSAMAKYPLPKPVLDPKKKEAEEVDEQHGLWDFFYDKSVALLSPEQTYRHGRAWIVDELRRKSWYDLHSLWWSCVRERNRIATSSAERDRLKAGFGRKEARDRAATVRRTQRGIKQTLRERWYAWEDARVLAESDPSVNLQPDRDNEAYVSANDEFAGYREKQEIDLQRRKRLSQS